ncbi:hypothetical protein K9N08_03885 [Candidatus Gracilibacteria bacterium]|nr:hypothetical protein [Candidatus Gracilibacteria bacterium]MCF7856662.1 hypothetical protein [Candidatus Gracilibacteria bacterium]MCF7896993.1 hypothetical protein [Candidatus Gracilibacteria bacterium]
MNDKLDESVSTQNNLSSKVEIAYKDGQIDTVETEATADDAVGAAFCSISSDNHFRDMSEEEFGVMKNISDALFALEDSLSGNDENCIKQAVANLNKALANVEINQNLDSLQKTIGFVKRTEFEMFRVS